MYPPEGEHAFNVAQAFLLYRRGSEYKQGGHPGACREGNLVVPDPISLNGPSLRGAPSFFPVRSLLFPRPALCSLFPGFLK